MLFRQALPMIPYGMSVIRLQDRFKQVELVALDRETPVSSGSACSGVPHPVAFIDLSSATLRYFTYDVVFLHNTKYPTTRPHRRTSPPHHAPAENKAISLHPPLSPVHSSLHIQSCFMSVRDKLSCESSGNRALSVPCVRQN